jgi:hypothetical protein
MFCFSSIIDILFHILLLHEVMVGHSTLCRCHIMSSKITTPVMSADHKPVICEVDLVFLTVIDNLKEIEVSWCHCHVSSSQCVLRCHRDSGTCRSSCSMDSKPAQNGGWCFCQLTIIGIPLTCHSLSVDLPLRMKT